MRLFALVILSTLGVLAAVCAQAAPIKEKPMPAPIVFFDIAGPDSAEQSAFYRTVFDWDVGPDGRFSTPVAGPLAGALRADPPEKVLYIGVDDITATQAKIVANGGRIVAPRFEIKGVVILGLFTDPAGNRLGLVEMTGAAPKIP